MNKAKRSAEKVSFHLYVSPDGEVHDLTLAESRVAMRLAGETELTPGGMIVMSTDVNATVSGSKLKAVARGLVKTLFNRLLRSRRVDETMKRILEERGMDTGWSIGNLFKGRYYSSKSGKVWDEKSFSIDIRGVPFEFVKDVARVLMKKFDQESVLVVDNKTNRTFLLD